MTKIEQLSELLVSEISQFQKSVEKLEKIQQQKLPIDSSSLETAILNYQEKMEQSLLFNQQEMKSLSDSLERAKAYPAWALTTFTLSLMANGILIYILFFAP